MAGKRILFQYSEDSMQAALKAIREENMAVSTACRTFGVPRTSVRNRLSGRTADNCRRVGPEASLGVEIEKKIVDWILLQASQGFPINREGLFFSVQKLVEEFNIKTPFVNNVPGNKWFESFLKRNPVISRKHSEYINRARAAVSEAHIKQWFVQVREQLGPNIEILNHPERIFNMDETAIFLSPKGNLVLGAKGKGVYDVTHTSEKDNVTTLVVASADGKFGPPLTLFKFQRLKKHYVTAAPKNWTIGISESGWMQSKQFFEYFANVFVKYLDKEQIARPVIVFLDGHASHLSLSLSNFCRSNEIVLVCLPPNTTHILQPLDVAFFYPLKAAWKKLTKKWQIENGGKTLQKRDVPAALNSLFVHKDFSKSIISGFRACGLYPFDENAPDYEKCVADKQKPIERHTDVEETDLHQNEELSKSLEKYIEPKILDLFKDTLSTQSSWRGKETYLELYNVWKSVKKDSGKLFADVSLSDEILSDDLSDRTADIISNDVFVFDFPELEIKPNINRLDKPKINVIEDIVLKSPRKSPSTFLEEELKKSLNMLSDECDLDPQMFGWNCSDVTEFQNTDNEVVLVANNENVSGNGIVGSVEEPGKTIDIKANDQISEDENSNKMGEENNVKIKYNNNVADDIEKKQKIEDKTIGKPESKFKQDSSTDDIEKKQIKDKTIGKPESKCKQDYNTENKEINSKTISKKTELRDRKNQKPFEEKTQKKEIAQIEKVEALTSGQDIRFFKKRSISEVLKEIVVGTEPSNTTNAKKRKRLNLPSVITHDQWIELMEAKETEKKTNKKTNKKSVTKTTSKEKKTRAVNVTNNHDSQKNANVETEVAVSKSYETITAFGIGTYVILKYDKSLYPAKIVQIQDNEYCCCAMVKSCENWKWPDKNDILWYRLEDIFMKIEEPKQVNSRGVFCVPELKDITLDMI